MKPLVLGVSGASGISLAVKALKCITAHQVPVELVITRDAQVTAVQETGKPISFEEMPLVRHWKIHDFFAPIASGSFQTRGMLILPCSMASVAAIAMGLSDNLLRRAADVTIKEGRKLLIAPREAPLNAIHLENLLKLSRIGVLIHPPVPAWYAHPKDLEDAEWYMVYRMLDPFIPDIKYNRWGDVT